MKAGPSLYLSSWLAGWLNRRRLFTYRAKGLCVPAAAAAAPLLFSPLRPPRRRRRRPGEFFNVTGYLENTLLASTKAKPSLRATLDAD